MLSNLYEPDFTFTSDAVLYQAVERLGTPLLVYSKEVLLSRIKRIYDAFAYMHGFQEFFPVKACPNPEILRILVEAGCGLVCSNAVEMHLAKLANAPKERLLFHASFPDATDLEALRAERPLLILDHPAQLSTYAGADCLTEPLGLCLHPGSRFCVFGRSPSCVTSRFGMTKDVLLETAEQAAKLGVRTFGLHLHLGSNVDYSGYLAAKAEVMLKSIPELECRTKGKVTYCNIGGGIAVYDRQGAALDLVHEAALVQEKLLKLESGADVKIHAAFGKFLSAPAAVLLTKVLGIQEMDRTYVGLDISMADLPRMVYCGGQHHVSKLGDASIRNRKSYYLAGKTMDALDQFGGRRVLPALRTGDVLIFHDTGAYTRSAASNYGSSPRCAEVLLAGEELRLIGKREDTQALLQNFVLNSK